MALDTGVGLQSHGGSECFIWDLYLALWDIQGKFKIILFSFERAVQERSLHEEHLIWLLSALTAFLWGDQLMERIGEWEMLLGHKGGERRRSVPTVFHGEMPVHLREEALLEQILHSVVIPLLGHHLANDSVLDVSQHMELYQVFTGFAFGVINQNPFRSSLN